MYYIIVRIALEHIKQKEKGTAYAQMEYTPEIAATPALDELRFCNKHNQIRQKWSPKGIVEVTLGDEDEAAERNHGHLDEAIGEMRAGDKGSPIFS
ncbi:hypothetical protein E3N88_17760 [Mikania micrantha]|uniref:Uncharacterized protein n=1 Tax=Mikania micrantha TaxID=192012 RepID=A0A5N6NTA9_9ASTR|nr:hypothetical protein E3N88_17760 [Mikania micrantha]